MRLILFFGLILCGYAGFSQELTELRFAEQVRRLTAEQADKHLPVHLKGVVTFFDEGLFSRFVQDETAGIYLREATNLFGLVPGQVVEVEGVTSSGEYAPIVVPLQVRIVGKTNLPPAKRAEFEQLGSGQEDSQFVEVHGIVRSSSVQGQRESIEVATGAGRLTAYTAEPLIGRLDDLVDSTVRIRGVCSTAFNRQRQLFAIRLMVPRASDFVVESPAPSDPFALPKQSISSLLQFTPNGTYGHRVKMAGSVIYQQVGNSLVIQDESQGLFVQTKQETRLQIGDRVEVLGFPAKGQYTPILQDAIYRKVGSGPEPRAAEISLDEALKGTRDSQLVRIQAMLLDRGQQSGEQFLVLQTGDFVFNAYLDQGRGAPAFSQLQNGSKVAVTGVCMIEPGSGWRAGEAWRAKSFRLLLRSGADVVVIKAPPWWTLRKLLWTVAMLCMVALAALTWVGVLRRRVQQQTEIISQKLEVEAALKERYINLFENANDAVYTHDLRGQITSMNQAGQRVLQRRGEELLSRNIIDLVVPEQQAAARQWLDQVLKGTAAPTVEWDFGAASGQRVKLEISTRLVEQNGQQAEVEGIARDITERKRLERELLEISNREQRRIGHDLHDGVCQQLAGIVYLTDTLVDRLQEKGATEAPDAERISRLINTAISQTRGVARGLFPVRLEDNGLVSALEELAADATELFHIACQFTCNQVPEQIDNDIALHVYYIAREAVTNAAKHGKCRSVRISLEPSGERYGLTVRDDGIGFKSSDPRQSGMGLRIMRYRAAVIGAALEVKSQPGSGTQVTCLFVPTVRESARRLENGMTTS